MNVNLKAAPFELEDQDISWVYDTIAQMSIEEKIGQLFIVLGKSTQPDYIKRLVEQYHIGGARYVETDPEKILEQNRLYQEFSKIPLLIAANCEEGGNGACRRGTRIASQAQCGAAASETTAYEMGRIGGIEATAIGCNWSFSPIADVLYNWRNTIVNTRSFSSRPDKVLRLAKAAVKGLKQSNILACAKHFPGDGVEERDQHLLMGINHLSCEEWDASFGLIYKGLIEDGLETIMAGHIALPSYSRRLCPEIEQEKIMPATLAPELLQGLLREKLGFNGLIVTDASHMGGLLSAKSRREQVPGTIAAGCDMFLFFHDEEEDYQYMMEGYKNGIISEERLQAALIRILGMKAKLGLHKAPPVPLAEAKKNLQVIGCEEHHRIAAAAADASITLVKDTQKILPVDVSRKKRVKLYYLESAPVCYCEDTDPGRKIVVEELERAGFTVDVNQSFYDLEKAESTPFNKFRIMQMPKVEDFKADYDLVFVFIHMKGYAQENNVRVKYSAPHSNELPWWLNEVPTICISLSYTNHLYDVPMMKTYINAYGPTRECIRAAVEKVVGKSPFTGTYEDTVWCDSWDTRC